MPGVSPSFRLATGPMVVGPGVELGDELAAFVEEVQEDIAVVDEEREDGGGQPRREVVADLGEHRIVLGIGGFVVDGDPAVATRGNIG